MLQNYTSINRTLNAKDLQSCIVLAKVVLLLQYIHVPKMAFDVAESTW